MINNNRIVPVTKIDLLSLYATMLKIAGNDFTVLEAGNVDGDFAIIGASENALFANQPVKSVECGAATADFSMYFVAAYDFKGFSYNGTVIETTGDTVVPDAATLYMAASSSGSITITNVMTGEAIAPADEGGSDPVSDGNPTNV